MYKFCLCETQVFTTVFMSIVSIWNVLFEEIKIKFTCCIKIIVHILSLLLHLKETYLALVHVIDLLLLSFIVVIFIHIYLYWISKLVQAFFTSTVRYKKRYIDWSPASRTIFLSLLVPFHQQHGFWLINVYIYDRWLMIGKDISSYVWSQY